MTIEEILKALAHKDNKFPREALTEAIAQKEAITPHLLAALEEAVNDPDAVLDRQDFTYTYAQFLLSQFRETKAHPLIARMASFDSEMAELLMNDSITEHLYSWLASTCDGDTSLIEQLIENPKADEFARAAGVQGLVTLVAYDLKPRDEVISYFKSLLEGRLEREPSFVWAELAVYCAELGAKELYEQIKQAYADDLIDETVIDLAGVEKDMKKDWPSLLANLKEMNRLVNDTIKEMEWWASYQEPARKPKPADLLPHRPYTPPPAKIGRNDPCPCGSGKKYKKCHGAN